MRCSLDDHAALPDRLDGHGDAQSAHCLAWDLGAREHLHYPLVRDNAVPSLRHGELLDPAVREVFPKDNVAMTEACRRTKSSANSGSRPFWSAKR